MQAVAHKADRPQTFKGSSGSSRYIIVFNVAASARPPDPFLPPAAERPANSTAWNEVVQVSDSFSTDDIPLWTPSTTPEERRKVFRGIKAYCRNCHCTYHSFMTCAAPLANSSHCYNPELGRLGDIRETYRRWQRRIQSYRRRTDVDGETRARRPRSVTTKKKRLVAKATTAETITGTPTLVSLVTVASNKVLLEALKAVARQPYR